LQADVDTGRLTVLLHRGKVTVKLETRIHIQWKYIKSWILETSSSVNFIDEEIPEASRQGSLLWGACDQDNLVTIDALDDSEVTVRCYSIDREAQIVRVKAN
jgi:hypothetical protein